MGKCVPITIIGRLISSSSSNKHPLARQRQQKIKSGVEPVMSVVNNNNKKKMESGCGSGVEGRKRYPLGEIVGDCVERWFKDTLKEAESGDTSMQVLLAQMYYSGYGIPKDTRKGRAWINRASKSRSSVWKVGEKRPGYNASDSDSDEVKEDAK